MVRLCFGTFVNVLLVSRKKLNKQEFVLRIIKTIDPATKYKETISSVPKLLNILYTCEGNFAPSKTNIEELAENIDEGIVSQRFEKSVVDYIDPKKRVQAVFALLDIIRGDATLNSENGINKKKFEKYLGKSVSEILADSEIVTDKENGLSVFLAKILRYTVTIDNKEGKEWLEWIRDSPNWDQFSIKRNDDKKGKQTYYDEFFKKYIDSFLDRHDENKVCDTTSQQVKVTEKDNSSSDNDKNKSIYQNETQPKQELNLPVEMSTEQMRTIFKRAYDEYSISEIISGNDYSGISKDLFDVVFFKHTIEREIDILFIHENNKALYKKIRLYTKILYEYKECLSEGIEYKKLRKNKKILKKYRDQLETLYKEICFDSNE